MPGNFLIFCPPSKEIDVEGDGLSASQVLSDNVYLNKSCLSVLSDGTYSPMSVLRDWFGELQGECGGVGRD